MLFFAPNLTLFCKVPPLTLKCSEGRIEASSKNMGVGEDGLRQWLGFNYSSNGTQDKVFPCRTVTTVRWVEECVSTRFAGRDRLPLLALNRKRKMAEWKVCEEYGTSQQLCLKSPTVKYVRQIGKVDRLCCGLPMELLTEHTIYSVCYTRGQ